MDLGLKDKVIIVTGGSKGIGKGIVSLLAKEGAQPVIIGRNKSSIEKVIKPLLPLFIAMIVALGLITYFPQITLWLPHQFGF